MATRNAIATACRQAGLSVQSRDAIVAWVAEQLRAQIYAKLGQGGHTSTQVPLQEVFIDLPVALGPREESDHLPRRRFLSQLLDSKLLDLRLESKQDGFERGTSRYPGNLSASLLIGGPGQGKSTLGQLACQLHRAMLLSPFVDQLTIAQQELVSSLLRSSILHDSALDGRRALSSQSSATRRALFPLQISLPEFAAWLSQAASKLGDVPVIFKFLGGLPSAKECGVTEDDLYRLISKIPFLLVLDGFDEVGATVDRQRIVESARHFLQFGAASGGRCQVIATTRPQGYADELSHIGIRFQKLYLSALRQDEALEYARKLVDAKIPGADLKETTLRRLHEAANEPSTQRLLSTPLQVTILTALVQQLGRAPRERWNLFSRYFSYTYEREVERATYASSLLSEHRTHIERIHARVGLLLQVGSEADGGASARMSRARLEEVIVAVLAEDEVAEDDRTELVKQIATAAEQRLVFLVEPEPGSFGFEIRSLQEFMAAWALTSGRDSEIEARLSQVARSPMFRNVALFVASRLFSEGSPLRDVLASHICGSLEEDSTDPLGRLTCAGALLALETLEEGSPLNQPKRARALFERAARLLQLPVVGDAIRLARVVNSDTQTTLATQIDLVLRDQDRGAWKSAWACLIDCINRGLPWALDLGERWWRPELAVLVCDACSKADVSVGFWLAERIEAAADRLNATMLYELQLQTGELSRDVVNWTGWLLTMYGQRGHRAGIRHWAISSLLPVSVLMPARPRRPVPTAWTHWVAAADFELAPSAASLARALHVFADDFENFPYDELRWRSSWPLVACTASAGSANDLRRFAVQLESGELGDVEAWRDWEPQWERIAPATMQTFSYDVPWSPQTAAKHQPFCGVPEYVPLHLAYARESLGAKASSLLRAIAEQVRDLYETVTPTAPIRKHLGFAYLALTRSQKTKNARTWLPFVQRLMTEVPEAAPLLVPRPTQLSVEHWTTLLGNETDFRYYWYGNVRETLESLQDAPGHPVLLRIAVLQLEMLLDSPDRREEVQKLDVDADLLATHSSASDSATADAAVLRMALSATSSAEQVRLLQQIASGVTERRERWRAAFLAIRDGQRTEARAEALMIHLFELIRTTATGAEVGITFLRNLLQKRTSGLDSQSIWNRLALPLPYPAQPVAISASGGFPVRPVWLSRLLLENVGIFRQMALDLPTPEQGKGQWTVLLGPNGSGKTTILRSLVLGLRDVRNPAIWPRGAFATPWQRVDAETTSDACSVMIEANDGIERRTLIRASAGETFSQLPEFKTPTPFPVFAYGCRRGSALGGNSREVDLGQDDGPEVATLFSESAPLIHAETWFVQLEGDAHKSKRSEQIYKSVVSALILLLDIERLEVRDKRLWVAEKGGPSLPFSSLSDGYLTSAGWFLDLIARWLDMAQRLELEVNHDFLSTMRGLVLIDEIDLHLHPRWQIEIIGRTRQLLPQMSFFVTTHNPLTLVGARAEEIWILNNRAGGVEATKSVRPPMLLTGGQIYREYFGIQDLYPSSVGRLLQRYGVLSSLLERSADEEAEFLAIQSELRASALDPGWEGGKTR